MFAYKINLQKKKSILTIINPIITAASKKICYFAHGEGCLTQKADKNFQGIVPRHYKITFQGVT